MNQLYAEGALPAEGGRSVAVSSHIPADEVELLYRVVECARADAAVEIGMAFGVSTLALADALERRQASGRLVVMDPAQHDATWQGLGLHQLARAGLSHRVEFHFEPF